MHDKVTVITGSIGSGKSTVADLFAKWGATVVSADKIARNVVSEGSVGLNQIVTLFGFQVLDESGKLDRTKLAEIAFSNRRTKEKLEAILHPLIQSAADEEFRRAISEGKNIIIYDCPLYFETKLPKKNFKNVIVVSAPKENCLERITSQGQFSKEQVEARMQYQIPIEEKVNQADFVIENTGTLEKLEAIARVVFEKIKKEQKAPTPISSPAL
jgi:dephospho-CoA kinase